ncbi:hypothetical protein [Streptomyces sp. NBC_01500]|uniref:hypothetical protein n=1 Tax=Streptomyces sp. NBC_01500 TaxID=2903886 RepID=UPI0022517AD7|nr:hypothetical protein [Streptomyces sp. NBC_01500]MCX4554224.1 hypothetical protein [Streptomyces sp. NBC_01500]
MSTSVRVARFYTSARRHPWVLGKVADFRLWLGPYTPAQIVVAAVGAVVLTKSARWWTQLGPLAPLPLIVWGLTIWVVRRPKIAGRAPLWAAAGWLMLLTQPRAGRIGGRRAHNRPARPVLGRFVVQELEDLEGPSEPSTPPGGTRLACAPARVPRAGVRARRAPRSSRAPAAKPRSTARPKSATSSGPKAPAEEAVASTVQLLLARTAQEGKQR